MERLLAVMPFGLPPIQDWPVSLLALEHSALVMAGLLLYVMLTRIRRQYRQPASAIAWVLVISVFPYVGIPVFLFFGTRKFARPARRVQPPAPTLAHQEGPLWAQQVLDAMDMPRQTSNANISFHEDGQAAYQALMSLIEGARQHIELCTFILANDEVGTAVVEALASRARAGVQVRVLIDAVGWLATSRRQARTLMESGVSLRRFMPMLHNPLRGRANLRNHRKLLVVDGQSLWSGGRNLAVEYFGSQRQRAWEDLSFVVTGPLARQAQIVFERDWQVASGRERFVSLHVTDTGEAKDGSCAQLVPSGPDWADDTVYTVLLTAAYQARHRIVAVTPYFVPDEALLAAWCMACRRGVELSLLVPRQSNHFLADVARGRALRELAAAGAHIYLFHPMIHAKAVVVDDQIALCGTGNLDGRSLFLNFELMTVFYGQSEIDWLSRWIIQRITESSPYKPRMPSWTRDVFEGVVRTVGFQL